MDVAEPEVHSGPRGVSRINEDSRAKIELMDITNETVCLITGASSGIGRALALRMGRRGACVAIVARRRQQLAETARMIEEAGGRALALPCDITRRAEFEEAVRRTIDHFGRLDVLVNNAGRGHFAYIEDTPEEQIESIFRVNVFALWYGTAPAIRQMKRQGGGHIINVSSMAGKVGYPANGAYVAAKHAVVGFNRALRAELAGTGIEATVVVPGGVTTDWAQVTEGSPMLDLFSHEAQRGAEIAAAMGAEPPPQIPLLNPDDVAEMIVGAIADPVPELYTHPGSRELALAYEMNQTSVEKRLEPYWLANREFVEEGRSATIRGTPEG